MEKISFGHTRRKATLALVIAATMFSANVSAQSENTQTEPSMPPAIEEHIAADGIITIYMPDALKERLRVLPGSAEQEQTRATSGRMGGFRIQVFADNNPRTAKSEARARARNIVSRFAEYPSYVEFKSPYWRTRIGNFRSQAEANRAAQAIKEAFPAYSQEIRVVRDRIVVGD